ncbi:hypothetical protein, partial [Paenibacillus whitsoniae]|uniref:hypothetical protein n=1 Tax=Paenibacillus whitsoniae TaxID=2496558 RepID=UPI0019D2D248
MLGRLRLFQSGYRFLTAWIGRDSNKPAKKQAFFSFPSCPIEIPAKWQAFWARTLFWSESGQKSCFIAGILRKPPFIRKMPAYS